MVRTAVVRNACKTLVADMKQRNRTRERGGTAPRIVNFDGGWR